jgi:hypothetical protein
MTEIKRLYSWELINPSDKYTLQAHDFTTAAATCLILGEGRYGLDPQTDEDGNAEQPRCPLFLFGGADDFIAEHFGGDLGAWLGGHRLAVADCLDSLLLGGFGRRADYDAATKAIDDPVKLAAFRESWQGKRSSMNDIGSWAHDYAQRMREHVPPTA